VNKLGAELAPGFLLNFVTDLCTMKTPGIAHVDRKTRYSLDRLNPGLFEMLTHSYRTHEAVLLQEVLDNWSKDVLKWRVAFGAETGRATMNLRC
jgi:hypothetical protein